MPFIFRSGPFNIGGVEWWTRFFPKLSTVVVFFYLFTFVVGVVNVTPFYFAGFLFISVLFAR